jgi:hypothetical protein
MILFLKAMAGFFSFFKKNTDSPFFYLPLVSGKKVLLNLRINGRPLAMIQQVKALQIAINLKPK